MSLSVAAASAFLFDAHRSGARFASLEAPYAPDGIDAAYDIQESLVARLIEAGGGEIAGYKVGLTSARMQAMCGIDRPIAGHVLAKGIRTGETDLHLSDFGRLGLEFEIGVRIGEDVRAGDKPFDRHSVAAIVDAICPAIEVIDDRAADYSALDVLSLVADNSWNSGAILGEFQAPDRDLAAVMGIVERDGESLDRGYGRDVLGHPFESLAWLANNLSSRGGMLRRGQIVLTGSLCPTQFPVAGQHYLYDLHGVGSVSVRIEG